MNLEEVARLSEAEFPDLVVRTLVVTAERTVRLGLRDGSFVDIFAGRTGRYSYHWQAHSGTYRFNNAPHFDQIETSPHHLHTPDGQVHPSPVAGVTAEDVRTVLRFVAQHVD